MIEGFLAVFEVIFLDNSVLSAEENWSRHVLDASEGEYIRGVVDGSMGVDLSTVEWTYAVAFK